MSAKQDDISQRIADLRADLLEHVNWEHNDLTDKIPVNVRQMRKMIEIASAQQEQLDALGAVIEELMRVPGS